ncbi:MAG: hypothetical protein K9K79_11330 [Desulfohalobiaceae bacterium]|nr:hypothetical protein [Desulfohalobiaceae bacterium]
MVQQQSHTEGQKTETFTDVKAGQLYCPDCGGLLELVSAMFPLPNENGLSSTLVSSFLVTFLTF